MAYHSFGLFCVLFIVGVFINVFDFVKTDSMSSTMLVPDSKDPKKVDFQLDVLNGEFLLKMAYTPPNDKKMKVTISYDTESSSAATFFGQLTREIFQGFAKCDVIIWRILPCSMSGIKDGLLICPRGVKQCEFDRIHACAATIYKNDQPKVVSFVICFFNEPYSAEDCANKHGMKFDVIKKCADSNEGAADCDAFYRIIHGKAYQDVTPGDAGGGGGVDGLKELVCSQLFIAQLKCDFCPPQK